MLIAFSGYKTSGKDTAARVLIDEYGFTKIAFADALRDGLLALNPQINLDGNIVRLSQLIGQFGWDWAKTNVPEVRRLMQVFGTEVVRNIVGDNVWIATLFNRYPDMFDNNTRYVITDCRFENECEFVRDSGGQIVWIDRPGLSSDGHASESDVPLSHAIATIHNDETIAELEKDVRLFLFLRGIDPIDSPGDATETTN